MRWLKVLVVVMGVMIVAGTATLGVLIFRRLGGAHGPPSGGAVASVLLDEPAGTRIASVAGLGDRLVVQLQGGGPDRVVVIDPRSGLTAARIGLAR
jgi:hypothetical protein